MAAALMRSQWVLRALAASCAGGLAFVHRTSRVIEEPADPLTHFGDELPVIAAMWHGQAFLLPFARPHEMPVSVMVSRSTDGEITAIAAEKLGLGLIRASGGRTSKQVRRRHGVRGFLEALDALERGISVAMTADVTSGPARVAGPGIVMLASRSGRPIVPIAAATSRRIALNTWDRATIHLPFSRMSFVYGTPIRVAPGLDEAAVEAARRQVGEALDAVNRRAYALVDGGPNSVDGDGRR